MLLHCLFLKPSSKSPSFIVRRILGRSRALPILFHTAIREILLSIIIILSQVNWSLRTPTAAVLKQPQPPQPALTAAYMLEMSQMLKIIPFRFVPFARFLYYIGKDVSGKLLQFGEDNVSIGDMEKVMFFRASVDQAYVDVIPTLRDAFNSHICDIFPVPPPPQTPNADDPDDLTLARLAPSITLLFTSARGNALDNLPGEEQTLVTCDGKSDDTQSLLRAIEELPPLKRKRVDAIRAHTDNITKIKLANADRIRQCTRCLRYSRGQVIVNTKDKGKVARTRLEQFVLGIRLMHHRWYRSSCVCGGTWKMVVDLAGVESVT